MTFAFFFQGCASGSVSNLKYKMWINVTYTGVSSDVFTTTKRVISLMDGEFKGCFNPGDMVMVTGSKCDDSGIGGSDHEKKTKSGVNNMNKGTEIMVSTERVNGVVEACGCVGDYCNSPPSKVKAGDGDAANGQGGVNEGKIFTTLLLGFVLFIGMGWMDEYFSQ